LAYVHHDKSVYSVFAGSSLVHSAREQRSGKAYWRFGWVQNLLLSREDTPSVFNRLSYLVLNISSKHERRYTRAGLKDPQTQSSAVSEAE